MTKFWTMSPKWNAKVTGRLLKTSLRIIFESNLISRTIISLRTKDSLLNFIEMDKMWLWNSKLQSSIRVKNLKILHSMKYSILKVTFIKVTQFVRIWKELIITQFSITSIKVRTRTMKETTKTTKRMMKKMQVKRMRSKKKQKYKIVLNKSIKMNNLMKNRMNRLNLQRKMESLSNRK